MAAETESMLSSSGSESVFELEVAAVADIDVWSEGNDKTCDITGVTVVSTDKLVVTDQRNNLVKLIDLVGSKLTSEMTVPVSPWAVTTINNSRVAVTLPKIEMVSFLACGTCNELEIETCFPVNGECYGIAYFQSKLIVTFDDPGKVEILSMTGDVLHCFEKGEQGNQLFINARYVSVYIEEPAIFVSDWDNDSLTKLSMDGKVLAVYNNPELSLPGQCVIDQTGLVYLCGMNSDNIHLLTKECTRIKKLLNQTNCPSSISYCEATGRLYLGMRNNDHIKICQLHDV